MTGHGFVGLRKAVDGKSAKAVFDKIDENGGGVVMLDEWCDYIKAAEVAAGTALGELLDEDEAGGVDVAGAARQKIKAMAARPSAVEVRGWRRLVFARIGGVDVAAVVGVAGGSSSPVALGSLGERWCRRCL